MLALAPLELLHCVLSCQRIHESTLDRIERGSSVTPARKHGLRALWNRDLGHVRNDRRWLAQREWRRKYWSLDMRRAGTTHQVIRPLAQRFATLLCSLFLRHLVLVVAHRSRSTSRAPPLATVLDTLMLLVVVLVAVAVAVTLVLVAFGSTSLATLVRCRR